ncbi:alpha/beta hydrolase [Nocardioides sp. NPDC047086]|uniref:alpha/beta fold hydrolase n=1 Tax=Nocardioides sp. NPDC047086 TaxID=3154810 RepID=UPI0033DCDA68
MGTLTTPVQNSTVTTGAYVTHMDTAGTDDGHPLLLLHGTGPGASGQGAFEPLLGRLSAHRCLVPDLLGFADSSHPEDIGSGAGPWLRARVDAVRALLDALAIERTHLLGHSYGARVVLELLRLEPERFGRVVLVAAGGTPVPADTSQLTDFYADPTEERMRAMITGQLAAGSAPPSDDHVRRRLALALRPDVRRSFAAAMAPGEPAPVHDAAALSAVDHDVLAVHGRRDTVIPYAASLFLAEHAPRCDLHVFAHAGHQVQLEMPDALASVVSRFLAAGDPA